MEDICNNCGEVYEKDYKTKYCLSCKPKMKKIWADRNPLIKRLARIKAKNNIEIPEGCVCKYCKLRKAIHRHHPNHSKPLEVELVCRPCHINIHRGEEVGAV
ncbi:hypothetical protein LCGC14_2229420 [marine sediment metagenome]|uniref:HNH nuclease domain-containing protein n=1 Tax=marine sediment metagenome TaxID=412755 RepID=A0A0F9D8L9_9ZZZZ